MEGLVLIVATILLSIGACVIKACRVTRMSEGMADVWWSRTSASIDKLKEMGVESELQKESVNFADWRDYTIFFSCGMFVDELVRVALSRGEDWNEKFNFLMGVCQAKMREQLSEQRCLSESQADAVYLYSDDGRRDDDGASKRYHSVFAEVLNVPETSKVVTMTLRVLANEFGTWT